MGYENPVHGLDGNGDPVGEAERVEAIEATRLNEKTALDDDPTEAFAVPSEEVQRAFRERQRTGGHKVMDAGLLGRFETGSRPGSGAGHAIPGGYLAGLGQGSFEEAMKADADALRGDTVRVGLGPLLNADHAPVGALGIDVGATELGDLGPMKAEEKEARDPRGVEPADMDEALANLNKMLKMAEKAHRLAHMERSTAKASLIAARANAVRIRVFLVDPERWMFVVDRLGPEGIGGAEGLIDDLTAIAEDTRGCVGIATHTGLVALDDFEGEDK